MAELVLEAVGQGGVAEVTLNRPQALNALSRPLIARLTDVLRRLDAAPEVRVILLSGAGRHFCAGADLKEMQEIPAAEALAEDFAGCCATLAEIGKPVLAAIHGCAFGGGCELVEMADIVLAATDARFAHPEITVGTMPGAGGTQRLPRALGKHKALDLLLTGRSMDAEEAERAGLVSRLVPPDRLTADARAVALEIAGFSMPALRLIKQAVAAGFSTPLRDGLVLERALFHRSLTSADCREGMAAFLDKRPARFTDA